MWGDLFFRRFHIDVGEQGSSLSSWPVNDRNHVCNLKNKETFNRKEQSLHFRKEQGVCLHSSFYYTSGRYCLGWPLCSFLQIWNANTSRRPFLTGVWESFLFNKDNVSGKVSYSTKTILSSQPRVSSLLKTMWLCTIVELLIVIAPLWGAIYICSVENIFLQTSHLYPSHRSTPEPLSICCSSFYLYTTCWKSPCSKPLGF